MKFKLRQSKTINYQDIEEISKKYNINKAIAKVILTRISKNDIEAYLNPQLEYLFLVELELLVLLLLVE